MRRIILATALSLMCGSAFAQGSTGPSPQSDNVPKPGMTNSDKNSGSMKNDTTTGAGMKKPAGAESKDGQGMNKGGAMSK